MKNVPKKDLEKKLLPFGIQVPKQTGSLFNIGKQDGQLSPDQRFNEGLEFYVPKRQLVFQTPLSRSYQKHSSSSTFDLGSQKNGSPDANTLLAKMGYGKQGNQGASTSMLASERDAQMKKRSSNLNASFKSSLGMAASISQKSGLDVTMNEEGDFTLPMVKEEILQRFLQRSYQNTKKRIDLIQMTSPHPGNPNNDMNEQFAEQSKKKLEHWNQISILIDNEIEEKLHTLGEDLIGVAEKYAQMSGYIASFMKSLFGVCSNALAEVEKYKQKLKESEEKIVTISNQKDQISEMLREKSLILKKFLDLGGTDEVRIRKERRENYVTFENSKLAAENQQLADKLKILETGADITLLKDQLATLTKESEGKINRLNKDLENREREIQKRKLHVTSMQGALSKVEFESRQLRTRVDEQEVQLQLLKDENQILINKSNMYRERALMGVEDYQGMLLKTQEQRKLLGNLREKSQALKAKLDRFTIARSKEVEVPADTGAIQGEQNMLASLFEGEIGKDKTFFRQVAAEVAKQKSKKKESWYDPGQVAQKFEETLEQLCSDKEIKSKHQGEGEVFLAGLQMQRASYFTLIEATAKNYELDMQNIQIRKISLGFVGSMRAILDSKYNEFILFEGQGKLVSRFADFAYAWFGKFIVDQSTREIRLLKESERVTVDDVRVNFLLDLWNPKLGGVWEIVTFREFLNEKASSDEIYFYLHCRNLLFKGPSLLRHETTFDIYQYMTIDQCEFIFDLILIRYDPVNVMLMKKSLREKIRQKGDKSMYETGFVLRVLLEFYRQERKNRYKLLKDSFLASSVVAPGGKFCIAFLAFKKIIQLNFSDASETEISQMYRDAYAVGQGSVTIDIFYAIANDYNFFLKYLQLNSFVKTPILDSNGNFAQPVFSSDGKSGQQINVVEYEEDDPNIPYKYFYSLMQPLKQVQEYLLTETLSLGIDRLYNEVEDVNYQINHKFQQDIPELRGRPFFLQVQRILNLWYSVKSMKAFNYHLLPKGQNFGMNENSMILKDFECSAKLLSELDVFKYNRKIDQLEKNNKFKKLQKMCRKKISKFYSFVSSLLSAKLKASVKEQNIKKLGSIKNDTQPSETQANNQSKKQTTASKQKAS